MLRLRSPGKDKVKDVLEVGYVSPNEVGGGLIGAFVILIFG